MRLVNRHLVFFEIVIGDALLQDSNHQIVGKLIPVVEASGWNGLKPGEEGLVSLVILRDRLG